MRRGREFRPTRRQPNLLTTEEDRRTTFWTVALGDPPTVYGERMAYRPVGALRKWDPTRSKLGAALAKGYEGTLPAPDDRWLYLGAASGTTASHVADLVGRSGAVFAVEKSLRPFSRLLRTAATYPNLLPILGDARQPLRYVGTVPPVDGVYVDVPQADQVSIAVANGRWFLRRGGRLLMALKTASMGRSATPRQHLAAAEQELGGIADVESIVPLEPFHRRHFFLEAVPNRAFFHDAATSPRDEPPAGRRR